MSYYDSWQSRQIQQQQANAAAEQATKLGEIKEVLEIQAQIEAQKLELERQRIRAQDLNITHQELLRRLEDVEIARDQVKMEEQALIPFEAAVKREERRIRWRAFRESFGLCWRNRGNWLRHPVLTYSAIRPYITQIEPRVRAAHTPLRRAEQDLNAASGRLNNARQALHIAESRV